MSNRQTNVMMNLKTLTTLYFFLATNIACFAQSEYTAVKNEYLANAKKYSMDVQKKDDLSFLLTPLNELKLDDKYVLSDFRRYRTLRVRDWSNLRLYVRRETQQRPDDEYFNKEYIRYRKCERLGTPYNVSKDQVAFTSPFNKISLTGTQMSIWQAYLLSQSSILFGMRDEGNYDQTYLITSVEDVNSILDLIKTSWDSDLFDDDFTMESVKDSKKERVKETFAVVDSLESIKSKDLQPVFTYDADSVTIEHYAFGEFHGLLRFKTTLFFTNRRHRHIKKIDGFHIIEKIANYSRSVMY